MKKIILLATALIITLTTNAQAPAIEWQKSYGGTASDFANSILQTSDGGYIMAGYSMSINGDVTGNHGSYDYWVVKINATGVLQWQKTLWGTNFDSASSIQQTADGGYIVAGYSNSTDGDVTGNHGGLDFWVVKLNAAGVLQWQKTLGGTNSDLANSIQQTADGGYIVEGITSSINGNVTGYHGGSYDFWVVKLNATGVLQWQKTFGGSSDDRSNSIQQTNDGGYIVAGYTNSIDGDITGNHGGNDAWVVKLNATGVLQWQKTLGGTIGDGAGSIRQTADGGYIMGGYTWSTDGDVTGNYGSDDFWVVKLNAIGVLQWQKNLGGTAPEAADGIQQTADGGYILAGFTDSNDSDVTGYHGDQDSWVVKVNAAGVLQWQKALGGTGNENATSIQQTSDGGYMAAGHSNSNNGNVTGNHGSNDFWIVKLAADPLATALFTNNSPVIYPNPANNVLNVQIENGITLDKLTITDLSGKVILTQTRNTNTVIVENLARGIYFLEAISEEGKMVTKFVKE